jgi:N-acetylglutamate synthase-like GNAT family acetyltransferase
MDIREAEQAEISDIKTLVDSAKEMDTDESTYTVDYFEKLLSKQLLLVAVKNYDTESVVGTCFGKYSAEEDWADMVGLVVQKGHRNEGIGTELVEAFEQIVAEHDISTIDLFADQSRQSFFDQLGYEEGRTYVAFRKHIE